MEEISNSAPEETSSRRSVRRRLSGGADGDLSGEMEPAGSGHGIAQLHGGA
jgi:hypothetical protein